MDEVRKILIMIVILLVWVSLPVMPYAQGTGPSSGMSKQPAQPAGVQPEKQPVPKPAPPLSKPPAGAFSGKAVQQPARPAPAAEKRAVPKRVPQPKPPDGSSLEPKVHQPPPQHPRRAPEKPAAPQPAPQPKPPAGESSSGSHWSMNPGVIAAIISAVGAIIVAIIGLLSRRG
jgi:periplasmic protein TonB